MNQINEQQREVKIAKKLVDIFKILSASNKLNFIKNKEVKIFLKKGSNLLNITPSEVLIPSVTIPKSFFNKPSPLDDEFVTDLELKNFIKTLIGKDLINRLNHVGLCYLVRSKIGEEKRLKTLIKKTKWHLYEEKSNDLSDWFFIGDTKNWQDPLIEFVPSEMNNDKWRNYWLPHFQIDIDTNLSGEEIENLVKKVFKGKVYPYRLYVVDGYISIIRVRLGSVAGINIELDLGTPGREVQHHREKLLKQLI